jgi:cell division protein FtsB
MIQKIKNLLKHSSIKQLQDVRVLGLVVFGVLAFLVSWSTISAIQTNYEFQKQIATLQQENDVRKLENTNQELTNKYYESNEFLELAARRQFGKAAPGEKMLIVPKNVALAYTVDDSQAKAQAAEPSAQNSAVQRNFQAWMNFFMHRQTSGTM